MSSTDPSGLRVRHVLAGEHMRLRTLRLSSLRSDPEAFGSTYARDAARDADWWKQWATESGEGITQRTFVLVDRNDRWLGLALVRFDDVKPDSAVLLATWVSPEARGRRAAASLCDACATWAREHGARHLTLTVVVGNDKALRAYEAAGFSTSEQTSWSRDERTLDVLVMSRRLTPRSSA
jgi:RimJ/RimL family protein N-acetyltransferase